jgi:type II secretory pathway pseudopilin PulG
MNGSHIRHENNTPPSSRKAGPNGFTLLAVLFMTTVFGISLMGANHYWRTMIKRENEKELLFRGDQLRKGIKSYYQGGVRGRSGFYPPTLEALLKDPRSMTIKRHVRRIYRDPMTKSGEWGIIRDKNGKIKGVFSKSREKPLKVSEFPREYARFETALIYSEWRFVYDQATPK